MAKVREIYEQLVEQGSISVKLQSVKAYDSLRTRLVKLYSTHKKLLDSIGASDSSSVLSVSGEFDAITGTCTFWIREAQKFVGKERIDFEIVPTLP